jgi:hypothetical protein
MVSSERNDRETISRMTDRIRSEGFDKSRARRMAEDSMRRVDRQRENKERRGGGDK